MINLTQNELTVIRHMFQEGLDCMGGETAADLKEDNMSMCLIGELRTASGLNGQALGGVLASLTQKGLVDVDGSSSRSEVWLTEAGIDAAA
jgi:hypothetical protein